MRCLTLLALLVTIFVVSPKHVDLPKPFADDCILNDGKNVYDPSRQFEIPWFDVNLDAAPKDRWTHIAAVYKDNINDLIQSLINFVTPIFPGALEFVDHTFGDMGSKLPMPYRDEIQGISDATGIPLGRIVVYNIFYEIFTVCTSIVAQDPQGHLVHARNLDFGLFLGWDMNSHEWTVSEKLRKMIINVNWIKNGKLLFKSNEFAGYIGIYNGMKPNAFSLTCDDRFQKAGGYYGIIKWLLGLEPESRWMSWLSRETLENCNSYAEAKEHLMNTPMLSPVYFILGGVNPKEGAIIARSLNSTALLTEMGVNSANDWYVLETNYDQDTEPLYLDDRDTPGNNCMHKLTKDGVSFQGIFNVLSSRTNLNKLTTYTVLMSTYDSKFETILQSCPGECWPW